MKSILLLLSCAALTGCTWVDVAIVADSATTYHAIRSGEASEANPLLPKSAAGAAGVSAAYKKGILYALKDRPRACRKMARGTFATGFGAAANNIAAYKGNEYAPMIGVGVGLAAWYWGKRPARQYCK